MVMLDGRASKKRARPELLSPEVSEEKMQTTTTTMPLPVRSRDEALGSLSLLDFLQKDSRPTFILDVSDVEDPRIAYRNPVLERLLASSGNCTAFDDWALTLRPYTRTSFHHGRAWACSLQRQQAHIIVNSPEALPVKDVDNSHTTMTEPRRYSHASSSWRTNSDDGPNYLDWIQAPSPLMTTHMHLVRNYPWHESSLGPIQTWPDSLRQNVLTAMANPDPRLLLWSDDNIMIYNEACITLFAEKHPHAMGSKAEDTWADVWHEIYPTLKYVKSEGRGTHIKKLPLTMYRSGHLEETYWSFNLVPVVGPQGNTIGVVDEFSEATDVVVSERRREAIVKINRNIANVNSLKELWFEFLEGLEACLEDVPYALLHTIPHADLRSGHDTSSTSSGSTPQRYSYEGSIGLATGHPAVPLSFDLAQGETDQHPLARACYKAWKSGDVVVLQAKDDSLPEIMAVAVPGRGAGDTVRTVCVLPLSDIADNQTMAFLTLALTARRPYDTEAAMLAYYLRDVLIKTASAICLPQEHRRARQKFEQIETSLVQQLRATALETERLENRFAKMSSSAPVGMFAIRPDSRTTFYNQAYLDITGITVDDIESRTDPASHLHEDDRERVMNAWYQCLEDKQGFTSEYRVKKAWNPTDPISGETLHGDTWVLSTATPELDEEGNIIHIQGWLLDISDRKYHEKTRIEQIEVEQSETRFARLAASAPLGMYLLTPTGKPLYLNDAYFAILGFTREEFEEAERRGVGWADQIHEDDRARVGEAWLALSQQGIPLNLEYRVKKPWIYLDEATGTQMTGETWVHGTAISEIGIDGTVVAIQGNCTEISLKKFSERLLSERLEDALEHKRQADRFIDMTSHEMRNPLSAILQSADGILTFLDNDHRKGSSAGPVSLARDVLEGIYDSAQTIILCAQHQRMIVDDILTLSKLDSNLLIISPDAVDVPELMEQCFKMFEAELDRAKITASLQIHDGYRNLAVENVMLDSGRLLQVVINLMTNAIKFTQFSSKRELTIHLDASSTRPTTGMYHAPWVPFRENRPEHQFTAEWGTGDQVFLHISIEDSGKGMDDEELKLLFNRFSQASPKTYQKYGGSGLGLFISRELTDLQDGQIGVHSEPDKGSTFSFYVKARRAVEDEDAIENECHEDSPLETSCRHEEADNRIEDSSGLLAVNDRRAVRKVSISGHSPIQEPLHLHVLVVEDNVINQRVMAQQLRRLGCTVHLANHGLEALDFLRTTAYWTRKFDDEETLQTSSSADSRGEGPVPLSVILMDLEMPVLGGLETVKRIRKLQAEGHIVGHVPVIAVTANARSEQLAVAIDHGMDKVVTKPFRIPELVPQMEGLVRKMQNRDMFITEGV